MRQDELLKKMYSSTPRKLGTLAEEAHFLKGVLGRLQAETVQSDRKAAREAVLRLNAGAPIDNSITASTPTPTDCTAGNS